MNGSTSSPPADLENEFGEGVPESGFESDVDDEVEGGSDGDEEDDDGIDDAIEGVVAQIVGVAERNHRHRVDRSRRRGLEGKGDEVGVFLDIQKVNV